MKKRNDLQGKNGQKASGEANHNCSLSTNHSSPKLTINHWAEEDRPREKLMRLGAEALSNAELLAILIGSGSTKESAVSLMQRVLNDCDNNLNTLGKRSIHELMTYNGVGEAKAITILAACELGKRRQLEKAAERQDLGSATAVYNLGVDDESELQAHQGCAHLAWRHHRDRCRRAYYHP